MIPNVALGRYFQIAPQQLKDCTTAEIRCAKRGCLLASVVEFDWHSDHLRLVVVQANTTNAITKNGQPDGPNATAPRSMRAGLTMEAVQAMTPGCMLDALQSGEITGAELEGLFRHSDVNVARIAYVATRDDFTGYSPNTFTRCDHMSGYLGVEHFNATQRVTRINLLT